MREILFRAKRLCDGEWEYGNLTVGAEGTAIERATHQRGFVYSMLVDPETVGQYIELRDRRCRRIYEGDIVREIYDTDDEYRVEEVQYYGAAFCRVYKSKMGLQYLYINESVAENLEVIGNKWENPELLNGGTE